MIREELIARGLMVLFGALVLLFLCLDGCAMQEPPERGICPTRVCAVSR